MLVFIAEVAKYFLNMFLLRHHLDLIRCLLAISFVTASAHQQSTGGTREEADTRKGFDCSIVVERELAAFLCTVRGHSRAYFCGSRTLFLQSFIASVSSEHQQHAHVRAFSGLRKLLLLPMRREWQRRSKVKWGEDEGMRCREREWIRLSSIATS